MASLLAATYLHAEEPAPVQSEMDQPEMALLLFLAEAEMSGAELVTPVDLADENSANSEVVEEEQ